MLNSTFDPFLLSNDITSELQLADHILLTQNTDRLSPLPVPVVSNAMANPKMGPVPLSSDLPDGDTNGVVVPLPESTTPSDRPEEETVEVDAQLPVWPPSPTNNKVDDRIGDYYLRASSLGLKGRTEDEESRDYGDADEDVEDDDMMSDSDSASSVPYGGPGRNALTSITPITPRASTPVTINRSKSKEVFESVIVPMPSTTTAATRRRSSQSVVINKANSKLAIARTWPRRWSHPHLEHPAASSATATNAFALTWRPLLTPTSSAFSSYSIQPSDTTARASLSDQHSHIKTECSPSPASSSSDLEAQIKTLDSQLRQKTLLLDSHNTRLDTLSPRLNTLVSDCSDLAKARKSLLDQRKFLEYQISANREELKETKVKAQKLQERQAEVMEARDKAQYGLDVLMEEKKGVLKALANKGFEQALEAKFPDKGARELARQVGWRPAPVQIELSDDESDDAERGNINKRPQWLRIANTLIDGDQSLDFADLSGLQEGFESVDKRVKQEHDRPAVKVESPRPMETVRHAALLTTGEPSSGTSSISQAQLPPRSSQISESDEILREPGIEDDLDLPVGEITLEKLQAHFKAMGEHKKEAAKMLRMLAGVQRGVKRKEAPGNVGGEGKKRKLGG